MSLLHSLDSQEISLQVDLDQGARIASLSYRGIETVLPFRGEALTWGWYAMAPWAGRIKNGVIRDKLGNQIQLPTNLTPPHAIHGQTLFDSWQELGIGHFAVEFTGPYRGARLEQRFEILDNALRWSLEYENGDCELDFWLGMHPWFPRELGIGGQAEIDFHPALMFERSPDYLPTGRQVKPTEGPWDDCFTGVLSPPKIYWQDALEITIDSDAPYWVIYDQDPEAICIEPQSAPPDAQNLGISSDNYLEALFIFNEI